MTTTNPLLAGPRAKPAAADHPVHELLAARWSPRAFSDQEISDANLHLLFEAARWAPSGSNEQPWSFVFARRTDTEGFARILESISPNNATWAKGAAVLMITAARINRLGKDIPSGSSQYDLGASVAMLSVQATALGIALHQMGGFDAAKAQSLLGVPDSHRCHTAIAIGYPGDPALLPDDLRQRETVARVRNPLNSFVFAGSWGKGI